MKSISWYLLQVIASSGLLYGYYHLFLRNKRFHKYNRYYLLTASVLSLALPFLDIPVYFTAEESSHSVVLQTLTNLSQPVHHTVSYTVQPENIQNGPGWKEYILIVYALISIVIIARIFISLKRIRKLLSIYTAEPVQDIIFVNTLEPGTPFSFFNYMFWNRNIDPLSAKGKQIFRHEMFHITQRHSADLLFLELLTAIFWINPFFHFVRKEVKAIHEFLADEFALNGSDKENYAELLLMHALNTRLSLINPFFHNQVKRRIAMIIKSEKAGNSYLRKLLALPLAAIVIVLFAFNYKTRTVATEKIKNKTEFQQEAAPTLLTDTSKPVTILDSSIRRKPDSMLVIIDNREKLVIKETDHNNLDNLVNPGEIASINILKGKEAISKYGKQWAAGVIEIQTKSSISLTDKKFLVVPDTIKPVKEENNLIFEKVEIEPAFPGGESKWQQYLGVALDQAIPARNGAPKGDYSVIILFIVKKDGTIRDLNALTKFGYGMEEEAMRVLRKGPQWLPAIQNGRVVDAYKKVVITFYNRSKTPTISMAELENISTQKLLQLTDGVKPISFIFTIDAPNGDIVESSNTDYISPRTRVLMKNAKPGNMIIIDQIRILEEGKEKKYPGKVYQVTD